MKNLEADDFKLVSCWHCAGEGYLLHAGAAAVFSGHLETYLPAEGYALCPLCYGEGELEVCATCSEPFEIISGAEVCACAVLELPKAA